MLEDLKIKLQNYAQFLEAWDAFLKLGYHPTIVPCTAPYLYTHKDGSIRPDFFDVEGADLSSPNSALWYFDASEHKEITLDELKIMAYGNDMQMTSEQQIEQEIQEKGLNAPRLTPEHIDSKIKAVEYILARDVCKRDNGVEIFDAPLPLQTLTFCILTLENGFTVTGESACVSPENFDAEIGKDIAYQNAREKIWQLEGYLLKQQIHHEAELKKHFAEQGINKDAVFVGINLESLEGQLPTSDEVSAHIGKNPSNGEPPVPTAVNCGESSGSVNGAQSCSGSASYGNTNHRTIELLLEILRTSNVGGDVSDKARTKLSELVDKI